jgi:hypothetical protein
MDLRNNELGYKLGLENKLSTNVELKEIVITAIKDGKAWYLKRNKHHFYVDCSNKPLELNYYRGQWFIPKCLIQTNN